MTRDQTIIKMVEMANELVKDYSWEKHKALWDMCYNWNSTHEEREKIFMIETSDDEENVHVIMIEDNVWYWEVRKV